jgi:2'-5' RNA ligase
MRAFMAVEVDKNLVNKIIKVQKKIDEANALVKFVEPENLHFTFKFLGETSPDKINSIIDMTERKVEEYSPFQISIKGTGVFPNMGYIRVIWLGVEHPGAFSKVQRELDDEFSKMGFKKERSYTPHLTIGRVKGVQNKEQLTSIISELETVEIGSMTVDRLILKESELTPVGPIYSDIKEIFL